MKKCIIEVATNGYILDDLDNDEKFIFSTLTDLLRYIDENLERNNDITL